MEIKYQLNILGIHTLINTNRVLIKVNNTTSLLYFFIIFKYFIKKLNNDKKTVFIVKLDENLQVLKRKTKSIDELLKEGVKTEISYENLINLINEVNDGDFHDSGTNFKGEVIGLEIRVKGEIEIEIDKETREIHKAIEKTIKNLKNEI